MEKIVLEGGTPLHGTIRASGAKNAALPILVATLLCPGEHRFSNVPDLADISHTLSLLGRMGCPSLNPTATPSPWGHGDQNLRVDTSRVAFCEAPYDVVRKMRASVLVLGPLLARCGEARVSLPGGCAIGTRPIDLHLRGLEALGCRFELRNGMIHGLVDELVGADIHFRFPTVGGTENLMMAAVLARGTTRIFNAAREPEIVALADYLNGMGAQVLGAGTETLTIEGVRSLQPMAMPYRILPDRIETGTYLCAAAATGGDITVTDTDPSTLGAVLDLLRDAGCDITTTETTVRCRRDKPLEPFHVATMPYPGFPTDMQAQVMALACLAGGRSVIEENIFENRFMHAAELRRMGASIEEQGNRAVVHGTDLLQPASVMASDLRASAALVIAGLAAPGVTQLLRIYHLDRGYDDLVGKLRGVGARIARVNDAITDVDELRRILDRVDTGDVALGVA